MVTLQQAARKLRRTNASKYLLCCLLQFLDLQLLANNPQIQPALIVNVIQILKSTTYHTTTITASFLPVIMHAPMYQQRGVCAGVLSADPERPHLHLGRLVAGGPFEQHGVDGRGALPL